MLSRIPASVPPVLRRHLPAQRVFVPMRGGDAGVAVEAVLRGGREAEAIEGSYALRVKVMGGGCSGFQYDLYFDEPAEGDQSFTSNGVPIRARNA